MSIVQEILDERRRQIGGEGWSVEHDDEHTDGSLAQAAAAYALPEECRRYRMQVDYKDVEDRCAGHTDLREVRTTVPAVWPVSWASWWWKPKDRRRDLVRAGALIVAEIERLDRQRDRDADDAQQLRDRLQENPL